MTEHNLLLAVFFFTIVNMLVLWGVQSRLSKIENSLKGDIRR